MTNPRIGKPFIDEADCPDDGGKWAVYCEHEDGSTGILQDSSKRRLSQVMSDTTGWCCFCIEAV